MVVVLVKKKVLQEGKYYKEEKYYKAHQMGSSNGLNIGEENW